MRVSVSLCMSVCVTIHRNRWCFFYLFCATNAKKQSGDLLTTVPQTVNSSDNLERLVRPREGPGWWPEQPPRYRRHTTPQRRRQSGEGACQHGCKLANSAVGRCRWIITLIHKDALTCEATLIHGFFFSMYSLVFNVFIVFIYLSPLYTYRASKKTDRHRHKH